MKPRDTYLFYTDRCRIANNSHLQHGEKVFGGQDNHAGFCGLVPWCSSCALRGLDTGDHSDISKACYPRCKKTLKGSFKVKIDLCQRS